MALSAADIIARRIARLQEQLDYLESLPEDDFDNGAVISFTKKFRGNVEYTYVALKAGNRWWLSGTRQAGVHSWDELIRFIAHDEIEMPDIFYVTEWETL